jgi:hypothetical protein
MEGRGSTVGEVVRKAMEKGRVYVERRVGSTVGEGVRKGGREWPERYSRLRSRVG